MKKLVVRFVLGVALLGVAYLMFVPMFGRASPEAKYRKKCTDARVVRHELIQFLQSHLIEGKSIDQFLMERPELLWVNGPNHPRPCYFEDVRELTDGRVFFASSAPVENPETEKLMRFVVRIDNESPVMTEAEYQALIQAAKRER